MGKKRRLIEATGSWREKGQTWDTKAEWEWRKSKFPLLQEGKGRKHKNKWKESLADQNVPWVYPFWRWNDADALQEIWRKLLALF